MRKASFQLIDTHIHSLQKELSSLDEQLHVLKKQLNQLCNPLTCPYIKGIVLNLNAQLHSHVQNTKNKKLSHLRTSQCCCSAHSVAGKPSHQDQSVTDCDAALAVDGPCKNQTTSCHVDGPEIATPAAADDGPCENQTIFCHVDELNIVTHWIQHGLSREETEQPRSARVPP